MDAYRTELKFLCTERQLLSLESRISLLCGRDPHADENGNYRIRSLYFDSPDRECYRACKSGEDDRKKYRIRIYNGSPERASLECKKGLHGKKKKDTVLLSGEEFETLCSGSPLPVPRPEKVLLDLEQKLIRGYLPAVVVGYLRTAYIHPAGNVRITFDREITAIPRDHFLDAVPPGIPVLPEGSAVLEVKYDGFLPKAILKLIKDGNLITTSYSKYAMCMDALSGELSYSLKPAAVALHGRRSK